MINRIKLFQGEDVKAGNSNIITVQFDMLESVDNAVLEFLENLINPASRSSSSFSFNLSQVNPQ